MIKRAKYLAMERPETWKKYTNLHIIIMSHNISFTTLNITAKYKCLYVFSVL